MKKLIAIFAMATILVSCKWSGDFTIKGQIDGFGMFNEVQLMVEQTPISSATISEDGSFELKGSVTGPTYALLAADGSPVMAVYIDGGSIQISGVLEENSFQASGTPSNDASAEFNKAQKELYARYDTVQTDDERAEIEESIDALIASSIEKNNNLFGLVVLAGNTYSMSGDEIIAKLDTFSAELQNTEIGKKLRTSAEEKRSTEPGKTYIDIALPDKDGNTIKLSDYVGKGYVLVDFWASWCGPCMQELPYLLDSYARYHDKGFEIFGVSLDNDKEAWINTIDENKMTWIQTARLMDPETTATKDYSVSGIPANYLIDPSGVIVAKNLRGEEVAAKLAELIK